MAKLTLTDITSGYQATTAYNANNTLIETALENTLSRDGTTPNQMTADIDLNSKDLLNAGTVNTDSLRLSGTLLGTGSVVTAPLASAVNYTPAGTGAVDTDVQTKLRETVSVMDFGADNTGATDSTVEVQAAIDYVLTTSRGGVVFFPPGIYEMNGVEIDGPTGEVVDIGQSLKIHAPPGALIQDTAADATSVFKISGDTATNFLDMDIAAITVASGGGHVIDVLGTLNHSRIKLDFVNQDATDKSIIKVANTNFFFNIIEGLFWSITTSHSVPAIDLTSTNNKITANNFDILRPDRSGTVPFMVMDSTSTSDYNYGNEIKLSNPEVCQGGVLRVSRAMNTVIHQMHCFDMGTINNHVIEIGVATYDCKNTKILNYQRNSGTLNSGIKDIMITDANVTYIGNPSGVSSGQITEIDLGSEPHVEIEGGFWIDVINWPQKSNELTLTGGSVTVEVDDEYYRIDTPGGNIKTVIQNGSDITINSDGTVPLVGDTVLIAGTTDYNGSEVVTAVTQETGSITAFADAGDSTHTVVTATNTLLIDDNSVTISGTNEFDGTYTVSSRAAGSFEIDRVWSSDVTETGTYTVDWFDVTDTYVSSQTGTFTTTSAVLNTINGGHDGLKVILQQEANSRDVTVAATGGNFRLNNGDFLMNRVNDTITLLYNFEDLKWHEVSRSDNTVSGSELTISSGAITATSSYHTVDTESDASTDTLSTINGGRNGMRLVLQSENGGRDITIDTAGNIQLAGGASFVLSRTADTIEFIYRSSTAEWHELSRSDNLT